MKDSNPAFDITHEKSLVVDGETAFIQSLNWETRNLTETRDFAVVTLHRHEVDEIVQCLDADWNREKFDSGENSHLVWCNVNGRNRVARFIDAATRRCVRQADLVLIVGNANGSPALSNIEAGLLARAENQQIIQCLVLLHDEKSDLPQNTREWLASRNLRHHYHVCLQRMTDFRRIGRLLTGQGVGLVLSGGGARAMAHMGVIRALVEKGVPIDAICGTSGGALFA